MTKKIIYTVIFSCVTVLSFGQSANNRLANTLLWEISGNGLSKPSYLYGTMHVSNKIAFHLRDSFLTAISQVDNVATELNPDTWLKDMMNSSIFKAASNYASEYRFGQSDFYDQMITFNTASSKILKENFVDNTHLINSLMYRMTENGMGHNYEEGTYLDMYIYQTGKKLNKRTMGLEDFEQSMQMLIKANIPDDNPSTAERPDYNYYSSENVFERIEKAYRRGDLNELDSLEKLTYTSKNFEKYLILERNKIMANRMDSIMKNSGPLFTGVGAAHLPGKEGIIRLLEAKGYKVRPVLGPESSEGKKMREKVETKIFEHKLTTHYLSDSLLQYTLPAPLIRTPENGDNEMFLYADIANGCHYSIHRLKHFAHLFGQTEKFIAQQVDSAIYETIPGKITMKKAITSNTGYPGIAISSKLPSGRFMQFLIFYTPMELIICKAGGTEYGYKSEEWSTFFNSIKFNNRVVSKNWKVENYNKSGFSANLPEEKVVTYSGEEDRNIRIHAFDKADSTYYFIVSDGLHDYNYLEDDTFELNYITEELAEKINASLEYRKLTDNNKSINALYNSKIGSKKINTRVSIVGNQYYLLGVVGKDKLKGKSFFDSFTILKPIEKYEFKTLIDSSMQFSATTDHVELDKKDDMADMMQKLQLPPSMMQQLRNNTFLTDRNKEYYALNQPYGIEVSKRRFDPFYYAVNIDSLWKSEIKSNRLKSGNYVQSSQLKTQFKDSLYSTSYFMKDSLSRRAFWIKKVLKNDHLFTLTTLVDTVNGLSTWQKNFYDSFTPWDTCKVFNMFEFKGKKFISDLNSKDSTTFADVFNNFYGRDIIGKDTATDRGLLKFIESERYKGLSIDKKTSIIRFLSYLKDDKYRSYPLIERLYKEASDTSAIQIALLKALAKQNDSKSIALVGKLMEQNLPLVGENDDLSSLFSSLSDSLEIARKLMPDMLKYLTYPEYKDHILRLFAKLIINNQLKGTDWTLYKRTLLSEALIELKRYNTEGSSKKRKFDYEYIPESVRSEFSKNTEINYSSEAPWDSKVGPTNLACYAVCFSQLYSSDNQAKQFVDKVIATGHKGLVYTCALTFKKSDQPVNDTIWNWLAKDNVSRMYFCDWLEITKDTALYPKKYYNQLGMSYSWQYAVNKNEKKDSVQFIKKVMVSNVKETGYIYFFKYKTGKSWKLNYVGFQPKDSAIMVSDFSYCDHNPDPMKNMSQKSIDEEISRICKKVRLVGRPRISARRNNTDYSYNDDIE